MFPGRYGAPHTGYTTGAHVTTTAEAAAHADRDGVQAQVLWGNDPRAHLRENDVTTR